MSKPSEWEDWIQEWVDRGGFAHELADKLTAVRAEGEAHGRELERQAKSDCKSCQTRAKRGLDGQCPACASERTHAELAAESQAKPEPMAEDASLLAWLREEQEYWERSDRLDAPRTANRYKAAADRIVAIPALIEAEREACATVAEDTARNGSCRSAGEAIGCTLVRDAIRARSKPVTR